MAKRLLLLSALAAAALAVTSLGGSVTGAASTDHDTATAAEGTTARVATEQLGEPHGITAEEFNAMAAAAKANGPALDPPPGGWPVPNQRGFHLEASCQGDAGAIRQGAAAWQGMTEGSDTPVECRNDYITDCGGGGNIVGCNWGSGQRIALFMGGVNDDALLAAHEFGHDWYGHSNFQCAGWGSPEEVMSPTICNLGLATSIDE